MTAPDAEPIETADETTQSEQLEKTQSEQLARIKRYDQRVEEWLTSLKDEAGQRSPEVLGALAAKAQDVADYLNKAAARSRTRNETPAAASSRGTSSVDESTVGSIEREETK